jgi:hypothetical protein
MSGMSLVVNGKSQFCEMECHTCKWEVTPLHTTTHWLLLLATVGL